MLNNINHFFSNYYQKTQQYSLKKLIFVFFLLSVSIKIVLILVGPIIIKVLRQIANSINMSFLLKTNETNASTISQNQEVSLLTYAIIIGPIIETFIGQVVPVKMISLFTKARSKLIIFSALIFGILHLYPLNILYAFISGILLSWAYIVAKEKSFLKSFVVTTIIHSLSNSLPIAINYLLILSKQ